MKNVPTKLSPRAALLIGAALLATPAFAQDAAPIQDVPVADTPVLTVPAPVPAQSPRIEVAPSTPIVQALPETPATPPVQASERAERAPARTARAVPERTTSTARPATSRSPSAQSVNAPAAAPVVASPAPLAEAAAPAAATPPSAAQVPVAAQAPVAEQAPATAEQTDAGRLAWPWLLGGLAAAIAGIGALMLALRRRKSSEAVQHAYSESDYVAPISAGPIAAAPYIEPSFATVDELVAREEADLVAAAYAKPRQTAHIEEAVSHPPDPEDLAGVADARAPVASRPWLEFGMRPVRAGTDEEEALVEFELTVGNSGDMPAQDVHVSTFMFADGEIDDMERLLIEHRDDEDTVSPMSIAPGEGMRIDATVAVPKEGLGRTFSPIVITEARYTLPGGRIGRTAAAFRIGRPGPNGIGPLGSTRAHMVEDVEAELYGAPEHA